MSFEQKAVKVDTVSETCLASSWVGTRMRADVALWVALIYLDVSCVNVERYEGSQTGILCSIDWMIGRMYAAVLPEPVLERAGRSESVGKSFSQTLGHHT